VPSQKGNERSEVNHDEERQASYSGHMPDLWHQDVQNRKELTPDFNNVRLYIWLDILITWISSLSFAPQPTPQADLSYMTDYNFVAYMS